MTMYLMEAPSSLSGGKELAELPMNLSNVIR
jgi:hypothetical protein